jgi:nucleotide-binding universal stress UspA family protein
MFARILVPLDGSTFAESALPLAGAIARRTGATLDLVSAYDPVPPPAGVADTATDMAVPVHADALSAVPATAGDVRERVRAERTAYLHDTSRRVRDDTGRDAEVGLLDGRADQAILARVESSGADLVVMATHGRGPMERAWLGSVADHLVRALHVPVLLVRPPNAQSADLALPPSPQRVVATLDGSDMAEAVLDPAADLAEALEVPMVLLRAIGTHVDLGSTYLPHAAREHQEHLEEERAEATEYLRGIAADLESRGRAPAEVKVVAGAAVRGILDSVDPDGADVIAMATHGRGGLRRLVLGSVTDKVVRSALGPVLVVRPGERRQ